MYDLGKLRLQHIHAGNGFNRFDVMKVSGLAERVKMMLVNSQFIVDCS